MGELIAELVDSRVEENVEKLADRFRAARPFRHVVIDDLLAPAFAAALEESFPSFDETLALNEDGHVGGKAVHEKPESLGGAWAQLHDLVRGDAFRTLVGRITGIDDLTFDPWYFGGGTHENRHGQDLDPHVDFNYHPITRQHRRLNLIVYLERDWLPEWGGNLDLHRNPRLPLEQDEIVRVPVGFNRAVIFETTEHSWHGFERIDLPEEERHRSRRSFAIYYYTEARPTEETAPPHSTIYVERQLPPELVAGRTLTSEDYATLERLLSRRDQHLERLYRHISELKTQLDAATRREVIPADSAVADLDRTDLELRYITLKRRVEELEGSTSWRITAPLRALMRGLRLRP